MANSGEKTFTAADARTRLERDLPHWSCAEGALRRRYRTTGWKGSLMVANAIAHLAEAAWHHPELAVAYDHVGVSLSTHSAGGITEKDFALAGKIEEVVHWRPGRENGALEGTPANDPRFAYLRYDD